jgi:FecR-like protein
MKYLVWLVALISTLLSPAALQGAQQSAAPLPSGSAIIADMKGEATIHAPDGTVLTAQKGLALLAGSTIETWKGSILLSLADGSQVLIKARTRVQLQAPEQAQGNFLQLFLGEIVAKVQKRLGIEPSFRMGTPTAVIMVRGTRFLVDVTKKNKTTVEVYEGLVEVVGLAAPNRPILVQPGFSIDVGETGIPTAPRSFQGLGGNEPGYQPGLARQDAATGSQNERPQRGSSEREGQPSGGERED